MRTAFIFISLFALSACAADAENGEYGSDEQVTKRFDIGPFESVSLAGPFDMVVTVGPTASVRAEGAAEDLDRLVIKLKNGGLHVGSKREWNLDLGRNRAPVTVYVTTPSLRAASLAGSGDMRIDKVSGAAFDASIGGSGDIVIGSLSVGDGRFSIAGSGGITAAGSIRNANISVAGSGDVDLGKAEARTATVSIVGSGNVRTRASESADVSIAGSGDVIVGGTAKCSIHKLGSGDVHCGA